MDTAWERKAFCPHRVRDARANRLKKTLEERGWRGIAVMPVSYKCMKCGAPEKFEIEWGRKPSEAFGLRAWAHGDWWTDVPHILRRLRYLKWSSRLYRLLGRVGVPLERRQDLTNRIMGLVWSRPAYCRKEETA